MKPEVYASPLSPAHLKRNIIEAVSRWKLIGWSEVWKWFNSACNMIRCWQGCFFWVHPMSRIQVYDSLVATHQWMTMAMEAMKAKPMSRTCVDVQSDTAMDESDFSVGHVLKDSQAKWTLIAVKGFAGGNLQTIMQEKFQMCLWCPPAFVQKRRLIFHMCA